MKANQSLTKTGLYVSVLCLTLIACNACSKDEEGLDVDNPKQSTEALAAFNAAIANLQVMSQPSEASIEEIDAANPKRDTDDTTLECVTKTYKGAPGFNEMFTLDPTTDVIYPGALLKGESIPTGEYIGIDADRAPITISTSLSNITGKPSIVVDNPNNLSEVRARINTLLGQEVNGATPAQINLDIAEVYSEEHMSAAIGANYRGATKKISANLDFNSSNYKNTFVLKFIQRYFTLDLNSPGSSPSDLFTNLPNVETLGSTNPVYVSSVTYGRMVLYTVESDSSITKVKAAFDASVGSLDGTIDLEHQETINSSNIKALIIGGSGAGAVQAINGPDKVYEFIADGGNYSKDSPGFPLAYKLKFVKQGFPVAKVVLATEYQVRDCDLAYPEFLATIVKITGTQPSDAEIYGKLRIKMWVNGERLDANGNNVDDGKTWNFAKADAVDVQNDKTHTINESYTFKPYRPNMQVDFLEYSGELRDSNGIFGSTSIGDKYEEFILSGVAIGEAKDLELDFSDGITVHFRITRTK